MPSRFHRIAIFSKSTVTELLVGVLLFALALAIRLPYLTEAPPYTDEGIEVVWGLDIALGKHLPLTAVDPYDGPFFPYLIALLFRIFGTSIELPRLTIAVFGALTVVATYVLGRVMQGRAAGVIGAAFAMTSPVLVVLGSHHGWSSALTPFFITITAILLFVGVTQHRNGLLAMSGLTGALALQAHPASAVALLGMLVWSLFQGDLRWRLKQPSSYIAIFLFILAYAPMLYANARPASPMIQAAFQRTYAFAPTLDPTEYVRRLGVMLRVSGYFFSGGLGEPTMILRAKAVVMELALLVAFFWTWRQNQRLIPVTVLVSIALLPLFIVGDSYRYYFYLMPMSYVLLGALLVVIARALATKIPIVNFARSVHAVGAIFVSAVILYPLLTTADYYNDMIAKGLTNASYYELARTARDQGMCGERIYVEDWKSKAIESKDYTLYDALFNVGYVLTLDRCEHQMITRTALAERLSSQGGWFVIPPESASFFDSLDPRLVKTIMVPDATNLIPVSLYRVEPRR